MNRFAFVLALSVAASASSTAFAQDSAKSVPALDKSGSSQVDLALLGGRRPLHFRVLLSLDGRPAIEAWQRHMKRWYDFLERDGDGVLSEDELQSSPVPVAMLQGMRQGNIVYASGLGIKAFPNRSVNFAEFADYYRASGAGPLSIASIKSPPDPISGNLHKLLDRDGDGRLSRAELESAESTLAKFDMDDDEMISKGELAGAVNPYFRSAPAIAMGNRATGNTDDLVLLEGPNFQMIIQRLDKNGDGALTAGEFAIEATQFEKLDHDRNGRLDAAELKGWSELPPDAEWFAAWKSQGGRMSAGVASRQNDQRLVADDMDVQFAATPRQPVKAGASPAQYLLKLFKAADTKNAGAVTETELTAPASQVLRLMFRLLDRDRDGRLVEAEVQELVDLQADALTCHITLTFVDQGRELFRAIDADRDGRLSRRELRSAWKRISVFDRDKADSVKVEEIGRQCTVWAGQTVSFINVRGMGASGADTSAYAAGTPNWFIKMDVNGDGDVSRREFLGSTAEFRRLDADNDDSLSPDEAMRGKKK